MKTDSGTNSYLKMSLIQHQQSNCIYFQWLNAGCISWILDNWTVHCLHHSYCDIVQLKQMNFKCIAWLVGWLVGWLEFNSTFNTI